MERLYWESFSFAPGVHTHHAWTEAGDIFARDMRNVRADENAYLRLRQSTGELATAEPTAAVTGVYATQTHIFFLQSNGQLVMVDRIDRVSDVLETGALSGRLWIIDAYQDFVVGKTEGNEKGFWADLRNPHDFGETDGGDFGTTDTGDFALTGGQYATHALGLEPPAVPSLSNGSVSTQRLPVGLYVYALTAVRAFWSELDNVDLPPQVANKAFSGTRLMNGMESNPTYFVVKVGDVRGDVYVDNKLITSVLELPATNGGVFLSDVRFPDAQQTGLYVYRTDAIETGQRARREDVESLEFRVTDFLFSERPSDGAPDTEGVLHFGVSVADRPLMRTDNDRLPEGPAQIAFYNDLIFAAVGEELRYSDIRDGAPAQWAWPAANSIRGEGQIVCCVEHRGVLLYGGPRGLFRLTGTDEYNFDANDQVSAVGPVSRGAFGELTNGVGFIGEAGFYVTDGVSVSKVSSPFLDAYFDVSKAVDGAVARLPNDDELWSVTFANGGQFQFLRSHLGGFFTWHGVDATQFAVEDDVMFADGESSAVRTLEGLDVPVEATLPWFWFSQEIDFKEDGHGEATKVFKWLEVSSSHAGDGHLQLIVDGVSSDEFIEFKFRADTQRPVRIPINRRGERIQFRLSGTGEVVLRSLRLMAQVRSSRRRF